ncbi:uncharacterized protein LOC116417622 isoform X1 [Nasonia vitripennis]|uniref:Uncharacterized protein n=1 Tax=Nasonia vitripennis TaxID=7425 RepID=A0A7M7QHG5_NASVI|nr:uncharacterized protein LOC116417622 isoform X1 [Nasonia vitripennis]
MERTRDYDLLFKNTILQCKEENAYICDIQGFQRIAEDTFIFKEISFLNLRKTALPTAYLFKPPMAWEELTEEEKCMSQWLEKSHHGIAWNSGDIPYHRLYRILQICTQGVEKIFIKGEQKARWMKNILPNISISNVEDFGCPPLEEIISENQYFCFNHALCIRRKPMCAIHNVISIRAWLLNYLESSFGQDEIDNI